MLKLGKPISTQENFNVLGERGVAASAGDRFAPGTGDVIIRAVLQILCVVLRACVPLVDNNVCLCVNEHVRACPHAIDRLRNGCNFAAGRRRRRRACVFLYCLCVHNTACK